MRKQIPTPLNEVERLEVLRKLCLLDTPPDPVFDQLAALAAHTFGVPIALVSLIDERRQWFKSKIGLSVQETPREDAFCAYAINQTEPFVVLNALDDDRFADNPLVTGAPHIRFYAGAPLVTREGVCPGTLCIIGTEPRTDFGEPQQRMLRQLANLVTARLETLRTVGYVDALTLLPNRTRFVEDIGLWLAQRSGEPHGMVAAAVDVCGSDYFSGMIKALGHAYADGYVVSARDRLVGTLPGGTNVYRIGQTLFGFFREAVDDDALTPLFERIVDAFERPLEHDGIPHGAEPTLGAMRLACDGDPADVHRSLLAVTDTVREQGRTWGCFEAGRDEEQKRAFRVLSALPAAMTTREQLSLHYQPRLNLSTGACVGVEALLRWTHPEMGNVPPSEFIPLAERTALIGRVTRWVLTQALAQAARWQRAGHTFSVAVNVSAVDLDQENFIDVLCELMQRFEADPHGIELEFTESALTLHPQRLTEHLHRLRDLGVQIALDDFGTGYSNLNYLKRIPATTLKIDQSFIRNLLTDDRDRAIVPSMIRLGHDLGHRVVAEGIETQEVLDQLADWSCDEGQGYWIARPMPVDKLDAWLANRTRVAATGLSAAQTAAPTC
jgi:EAL domain-containing protein (putative c-di-GMP-specific phosphodiesterase class I)/GGDEF domain-containing protein